MRLLEGACVREGHLSATHIRGWKPDVATHLSSAGDYVEAATARLAAWRRRTFSTMAARLGRTKSRWTVPTHGDLSSKEVQPAMRAASASCHLSLMTKE